MTAAPNERLERTRHKRASLLSCVGGWAAQVQRYDMEINRNLFAIVMLGLALASTLNAQDRQWRSMRRQAVIAFDWNCSRTDSFPHPSLQKIVERSIRMEDRGGPTTYGDRAFVVKLRHSLESIYFVPTICGATGNCIWRLYTIKPSHFLGEINGQYIYTYRSSHAMPTIITYGNYSAMDGVLFTYAWTIRGYKQIGRQYNVNFQPPDVRPRPAFLENARQQCKDYGS